MDVLMLGVTGVALALAVGMSFVAVRLLRGERHRRAARIEMLEAAALDLDLDHDEDLDMGSGWVDVDPEIEIDRPAGPMFTATDEPKAPGRRWFALAAVAIVMTALIGTLYVTFKPATVDASAATSSSAPSAPAPSAPAPSFTSPTAPTTTATASQTRPIELLSLKHTIDSRSFSLVGLVENPIDAAPLSHVVAVVYLFDKDGAYFASGKAELEFPQLRPGEEAPFSVKIPNVGRIGKYRVGFRREDGSVIAHVDRRGERAAGSMTEGGGE